VATLGSIIVLYGGRFWTLARGVLARRPEDVRYAGLIVLAMIPAVLAGILLESFVAATYDSLWWAGGGFLFTGLALWSTRRRGGTADRPSAPSALAIGIAQALAILPGVSRSGMTVATGLWSGLSAVRAADFSFLMAIPLIAGAGLFEARKISGGVDLVGVGPLIVACIVAFVSGIWAIRWLVALLVRGRFHSFAPYCFAIGVVTLILAAWGR